MWWDANIVLIITMIIMMHAPVACEDMCSLLTPLLEVVDQAFCKSAWSSATISNASASLFVSNPETTVLVPANCTVDMRHVVTGNISQAAHQSIQFLNETFPDIKRVAFVLLDNLTIQNAAQFDIDTWALQRIQTHAAAVITEVVPVDAVVVMSHHVSLAGGSRLLVHANASSLNATARQTMLCIEFATMLSVQSSFVVQGAFPPSTMLRVRNAEMSYDYSVVVDNLKATAMWDTSTVEVGVVTTTLETFEAVAGSSITTWVAAPIVLQDVVLRQQSNVVFEDCRIRGTRASAFMAAEASGSLMTNASSFSSRAVNSSSFIGVPALIALGGNQFVVSNGSTLNLTNVDLQLDAAPSQESPEMENVVTAAQETMIAQDRWVNVTTAGAIVLTSSLLSILLTDDGSAWIMSNVTVQTNGTVSVPCLFHHPPAILSPLNVNVTSDSNSVTNTTSCNSSGVRLLRFVASSSGIRIEANATIRMSRCTLRTATAVSSSSGYSSHPSPSSMSAQQQQAALYGGAVVIALELSNGGSFVVSNCSLVFEAPISAAIAAYRVTKAVEFAAAFVSFGSLLPTPFASTVSSGEGLLALMQQEIASYGSASRCSERLFDMLTVSQATAPPTGALVIRSLSALGSSRVTIVNCSLQLHFTRDAVTYPTDSNLTTAIYNSVQFGSFDSTLPYAALMFFGGVAAANNSMIVVDNCFVQASSSDAEVLPLSVADLWISATASAVALQGAPSLRLDNHASLNLTSLEVHGAVWIRGTATLTHASSFTLSDLAAAALFSVPNSNSHLQQLASLGFSDSVSVSSKSRILILNVTVTSYQFMELAAPGTTTTTTTRVCVAAGIYMGGSSLIVKDRESSVVVHRAVIVDSASAGLATVVGILMGSSVVHVLEGTVLHFSNLAFAGVSAGFIACPNGILATSLVEPASSEARNTTQWNAEWLVTGASIVILDGINATVERSSPSNVTSSTVGVAAQSPYLGGVIVQGSMAIIDGAQWILRNISLSMFIPTALTTPNNGSDVAIRWNPACGLFVGSSTRLSVGNASALIVASVSVHGIQAILNTTRTTSTEWPGTGEGIWIGLTTWTVSGGSNVVFEGWTVSGNFSEAIHIGSDWGSSSSSVSTSPGSVLHFLGDASTIMWRNWTADVAYRTEVDQGNVTIAGLRWPDDMTIASESSGSVFAVRGMFVSVDIHISNTSVDVHSSGWWLPSKLATHGKNAMVIIHDVTIRCIAASVVGQVCVGPLNSNRNTSLWSVAGESTLLSLTRLNVTSYGTGMAQQQPVRLAATSTIGAGSVSMVDAIVVRCLSETTDPSANVTGSWHFSTCLQFDAAPSTRTSTYAANGATVSVMNVHVDTLGFHSALHFVGGFDARNKSSISILDVAVSLGNVSSISAGRRRGIDIGTHDDVSGVSSTIADRSSVVIRRVQLTMDAGVDGASGFTIAADSVHVSGESTLFVADIDVTSRCAVVTSGPQQQLQCNNSHQCGVNLSSIAICVASSATTMNGSCSLVIVNNSEVTLTALSSAHSFCANGDILVGARILATNGSRLRIANVAVNTSVLYIGSSRSTDLWNENQILLGSVVEVQNVTLNNSALSVTGSWTVDGDDSTLSLQDVNYYYCDPNPSAADRNNAADRNSVVIVVAGSPNNNGTLAPSPFRLLATNGGTVLITAVTMHTFPTSTSSSSFVTAALCIAGPVFVQNGSAVNISAMRLTANVAFRALGVINVTSPRSTFSLSESTLNSRGGPSGASGGVIVANGGSLELRGIQFQRYGWFMTHQETTPETPSAYITGGAAVRFSDLVLYNGGIDYNQRILLLCGGQCNSLSGFTPFLIAIGNGSRLLIQNVTCDSALASSIVVDDILLYDGAEVLINSSVLGPAGCSISGGMMWPSDSGALNWGAISAFNRSSVIIENSRFCFCNNYILTNADVAFSSILQLEDDSSLELLSSRFRGNNFAVELSGLKLQGGSLLRFGSIQSSAAGGFLQSSSSLIVNAGSSVQFASIQSAHALLMHRGNEPAAITNHSELRVSNVTVSTLGSKWEVLRFSAMLSVLDGSIVWLHDVSANALDEVLPFGLQSSLSLLHLERSFILANRSSLTLSSTTITISLQGASVTDPASLVDINDCSVSGGSSILFVNLTIFQCTADGLPPTPHVGTSTSTAVFRLNRTTIQDGGGLYWRRVLIYTAAAVVLPNAIRLNGDMKLFNNATIAIEDVVFVSLGTAFISVAATATWALDNRSLVLLDNVSASNNGPVTYTDRAVIGNVCLANSFPSSIVTERAAEPLLNVAVYLVNAAGSSSVNLINVFLQSVEVAAADFGTWELMSGSALHLRDLYCTSYNASRSIVWRGPVTIANNASLLSYTFSAVNLVSDFRSSARSALLPPRLAAMSFDSGLFLYGNATVLFDSLIVNHTVQMPNLVSCQNAQMLTAASVGSVSIAGDVGVSHHRIPVTLGNSTFCLTIAAPPSFRGILAAPLAFDTFTVNVPVSNGASPPIRVGRSTMLLTRRELQSVTSPLPSSSSGSGSSLTRDVLTGVLFSELSTLATAVQLLGNNITTVVVQQDTTEFTAPLTSCFGHLNDPSPLVGDTPETRRQPSQPAVELVLNQCRIIASDDEELMWRHLITNATSCNPLPPVESAHAVLLVAMCNALNSRIWDPLMGWTFHGGVVVPHPAGKGGLMARVLQQAPDLIPLQRDLCPSLTLSQSASSTVSLRIQKRRLLTQSVSNVLSRSDHLTSASLLFHSSATAACERELPVLRVSFFGDVTNATDAQPPFLTIERIPNASARVVVMFDPGEAGATCESNAPNSTAPLVTIEHPSGNHQSPVRVEVVNSTTIDQYFIFPGQTSDIVCIIVGVEIFLSLSFSNSDAKSPSSVIPDNITVKLQPHLFMCPPRRPLTVTIPLRLINSTRIIVSVSNETVSTVVVTAATVATIAAIPLAFAGAGGTAAGMQRALLQMRLAECDYSLHEPLDLGSSPTKLSIKPEAGEYIRGSIVGNGLLLVGIVAVCAGGVWCRKLLMATRGPRGTDSFWRCAASLALPGALLSPFMFFVQPIVSSSVTLLAHSSETLGAQDAILGTFGLLLVVGPGTVISWLVLCGLHATAVKMTRWRMQQWLPRRRWALVIGRLLLPTNEWEDTTEPLFVKRYGRMFEAFRGGRAWYGCVELWASVLCGVLSGVQPTDGGSCAWLLAAICGVNCAQLVGLVILRPFSSRLDFFVALQTSAAGVIWGGSVLGNVQVVARAAATAQVYVGVLSTVTFIAGLCASRRFRRLLEGCLGLLKLSQNEIRNSGLHLPSKVTRNTKLALFHKTRSLRLHPSKFTYRRSVSVRHPEQASQIVSQRLSFLVKSICDAKTN